MTWLFYHKVVQMSPHPLGHPPFWCQLSFLWDAGPHLLPSSTNSFSRLSWKESKAIPADALQRKREADTLTFWSLWHTNLPLPPHFKTKSGTTVAGALIRYQTSADCVRNDVRWTAVPGPLPHLGQTLKHLFFRLLYDLPEKWLCSLWKATNVWGVTPGF